MSLRINNNVEAFNAHRQLVGTSATMAKSMEKLPSVGAGSPRGLLEGRDAAG
jgi:hypothetical protein